MKLTTAVDVDKFLTQIELPNQPHNNASYSEQPSSLSTMVLDHSKLDNGQEWILSHHIENYVYLPAFNLSLYIYLCLSSSLDKLSLLFLDILLTLTTSLYIFLFLYVSPSLF